MNREERRRVEKKARHRGMSKAQAKSYAQTVSNADEIRRSGSGVTSPSKKIQDGDKVKLNLERIQARKNYSRMAEPYKEFVSSSVDKVFTAHTERQNVISLVEQPEWLFWSGDLDLVDDE